MSRFRVYLYSLNFKIMENTALKETVVEVTCTAKTQKQQYSKENPIQHAIELSVPYDQKSIFYQMSGGTVMTLNTVNQAAADMFEINEVYVMSIKPKPLPETTPVEDKEELKG